MEPFAEKGPYNSKGCHNRDEGTSKAKVPNDSFLQSLWGTVVLPCESRTYALNLRHGFNLLAFENLLNWHTDRFLASKDWAYLFRDKVRFYRSVVFRAERDVSHFSNESGSFAKEKI